MSKPSKLKPIEECKGFNPNGCTLFPDLNYNDCCIQHDYAYYIGGTKKQRLVADIELRKCVANKGHPILAWIMFIGVRLFGSPFWPHRHRWAFGYKYGRGYKGHRD